MNIRLIPLVAGAVIGAVTTYLYKDKKSRDALKKGIDATEDKISDGVDSIKSALKKKSKNEASEIEEAEKEVLAEKPKTPRKRKTTTAKKPAAITKSAAEVEEEKE